MSGLFPDERTDDKVKCRVCGTWVTWERSRLFWVGGGMIRTCPKGPEPHFSGGAAPRRTPDTTA